MSDAVARLNAALEGRCGVSPAARILIAVLVLAPTTSCWLGDSALGPDGRVAQLTLVPALSTQGLGPPAGVGPLAEVVSLGFIVRRMDGSLVVADTVPVNVESGRVEHAVEVTYTPPAETFTVELVLLNSNGDELFRGGPVEYTISDSDGEPIPLEVRAVYVGPTLGASLRNLTSDAFIVSLLAGVSDTARDALSVAIDGILSGLARGDVSGSQAALADARGIVGGVSSGDEAIFFAALDLVFAYFEEVLNAAA